MVRKIYLQLDQRERFSNGILQRRDLVLLLILFIVGTDWTIVYSTVAFLIGTIFRQI